jgi:hypothetical protein
MHARTTAIAAAKGIDAVAALLADAASTDRLEIAAS